MNHLLFGLLFLGRFFLRLGWLFFYNVFVELFTLFLRSLLFNALLGKYYIVRQQTTKVELFDADFLKNLIAALF